MSIIYSNFIEGIVNQEVNLSSDVFNMALVINSYVPSLSDTNFINDIVNESLEVPEEDNLGVSTGYTTGGKRVVLSVVSTTKGIQVFLSGNTVSWTNGSFTCRYAILYRVSDNKLAVCFDLLEDQTVALETFALNFTNGLFTIPGITEIVEIEDTLTSTAIDKALSANQGRILDETKANKTDISTAGSTGSYNDLLNKPIIPSVDNSLSDTSENPVQNKIITSSINNIITNIDDHISNISNPHEVTKEQIGLNNIDNTSDLNKPISILTQNALDLKANISSIPQNTSELTNNSKFISGTFISITLIASNWVDNTITLSVSEITNTSSLLITPNPLTSKEAIDSGIYCSFQGDGTITFKCSIVPIVDVVMNVLILS